MKKKKIFNNVIRLLKNRSKKPITYQIIAILNRKKTSSQDIVMRFGYYSNVSNKVISINFNNLAYYLNKGYIINNNIKKLIYNIVLNR